MIDLIIEYNDSGVQIFADGYPGVSARGETREEAMQKLPAALAQYRAWTGQGPREPMNEFRTVQECKSPAAVEDGETRVLFPSERLPMSMATYTQLKSLCLRSAKDIETQFLSIPQKDRALVKSRRCFYGRLPQTSREMQKHITAVQAAYAARLGIALDPDGDLFTERVKLFTQLEAAPQFLENKIIEDETGEAWTRKKLLRRLLWHDRLHARAMYRKTITFWQKERIENPFRFAGK